MKHIIKVTSLDEIENISVRPLVAMDITGNLGWLPEENNNGNEMPNPFNPIIPGGKFEGTATVYFQNVDFPNNAISMYLTSSSGNKTLNFSTTESTTTLKTPDKLIITNGTPKGGTHVTYTVSSISTDYEGNDMVFEISHWIDMSNVSGHAGDGSWGGWSVLTEGDTFSVADTSKIKIRAVLAE